MFSSSRPLERRARRQDGGADVERAAWESAVVFPGSGSVAELAATLAHYATNETARENRAAAAYAALVRRPFASALRRPVEALVRRTCAGWRAAPGSVDAAVPWQWDLKRG